MLLPILTLLLASFCLSAPPLICLKYTSTTPMKLQESPCTEDHVVSGYFTDAINETGWSQLSISTSGAYEDNLQAYAAGYLEGMLTVQRSYEFLYNLLGLEVPYTKTLTKFIDDNLAWTRQMVESNAADDAYWHQISLLLDQFDGLYAGYTDNAKHSIAKDVFYASLLTGDLNDLCDIYTCKGQTRQRLQNKGHCSVLIKPLPGLTDIIVGHTTWSVYETMTRIYKLYDFPFKIQPGNAKVVPGNRIAFSSYPTMIISLDDYFQINSGLVVTETTLSNNNDSLWTNVQPHQILYWMRVMVANRLSTTGEEWMQIFEKYNSGTYNNQWMVVDYNQFQPGMPQLAPGTLWVGEQMPGLFVKQDMTPWMIKNGYWASYNRPFFPFVFNISGQQELVERYGTHYSWQDTARAVIFRQKQNSVVDEKSFEMMIRYNDYMHDDIAVQGCKTGRSASNAIAERGDLTQHSAHCIPDISDIDEGAIDSKYCTYGMTMGKALTSVSQSGPPHDTVPPFVWSKSPYASVPHIGQPDVFAFPWIKISFDNQE